MKSAVVILSGGMDSTTLLYHIYKAGHEIKSVLSINYGQRHVRELLAAKAICEGLGLEGVHKCVDLSALNPFLRGSSQTDLGVSVPHGHYEEESMKLTVVPNRNMILLAVAVAEAISCKAEMVGYGAHAGDHAIYPDCRKDFVEAMGKTIALCDWTPPALVAPFIDNTKAEIVSFGHELGVPFNLTYSCYEGGLEHCGRCGTCTERKEAFQQAGVTDPTPYLA